MPSTTLTIYADSSDGTLVGNGTYSSARANLDHVGTLTNLLRFGQYYNGSYHLHEAFLLFDTSSIPDGATVTNAVISFYGLANKFSALDISMELRVYNKLWFSPLIGTHHVDGGSLHLFDKVAHYHITKGAVVWNTAGYNVFESTTGELANFCNFINKAGNTGVFVAYDWLENGHQRTGNNYGDVISGNSSVQTKRPRLEVTYTEVSDEKVVPVDTVEISSVSFSDADVFPFSLDIDKDCIEITDVVFNDTTITTTNNPAISVSCAELKANFYGAFLQGTGNTNIDGFVVYIHRGDTDNASYVFGTEPEKEEARIVPYNVSTSEYNIKLEGLRRDKYYQFMVRAYRTVDNDIDSSQVLYSLGVVQAPMDGYAIDLSTVPAFTGPFKPSPDTTDVPADFEGLYANYEHMGYVDHGVWKTQFDSQGNFYLSGDEGNALDWNGTTLSLTLNDPHGGIALTKGTIQAGDIIDFENYDRRSGLLIGLDAQVYEDTLAELGYPISVYKFFVGGLDENGEEHFMLWDGDSLHIQGDLTGSTLNSYGTATQFTPGEGIRIDVTGGNTAEEFLTLGVDGADVGKIGGYLDEQGYALLLHSDFKLKVEGNIWGEGFSEDVVITGSDSLVIETSPPPTVYAEFEQIGNLVFFHLYAQFAVVTGSGKDIYFTVPHAIKRFRSASAAVSMDGGRNQAGICLFYNETTLVVRKYDDTVGWTGATNTIRADGFYRI